MKDSNVNLERVLKLILFSVGLLETKLYKSTILNWLTSYFENGEYIYSFLLKNGLITQNNVDTSIKLTNKLYFEYSKKPEIDHYFSTDIKALNQFNRDYYTDKFLQLSVKYICNQLGSAGFIYKIPPTKTESVSTIISPINYINTDDIAFLNLKKILDSANSKYFKKYLVDYFSKGDFKEYVIQNDGIASLVVKKLNLSLQDYVLSTKMLKIGKFWYLVGVIGTEKLSVIRATSLLELLETSSKNIVIPAKKLVGKSKV